MNATDLLCPPKLRRIDICSRHPRWIASQIREWSRGLWRSLWLGVHAAHRLPTVHFWRLGSGPSSSFTGLFLFPEPPLLHHCLWNPRNPRITDDYGFSCQTPCGRASKTIRPPPTCDYSCRQGFTQALTIIFAPRAYEQSYCAKELFPARYHRLKFDIDTTVYFTRTWL